MLEGKPTSTSTSSTQWYLLIGCDHEGPFSTEHVRKLLKPGSAVREALAWREGMEDWSRVDELPEFVEAIAEEPKDDWFADWPTTIDFKEDEPPSAPPIEARTSEPETFTTGESTAREIGWKTLLDDQLKPIEPVRTPVAPLAEDAKQKTPWLVAGSVAAVIGAISIVAFLISTTPKFVPLRDLSREENRELQAVIGESLTIHGPGAAIAMSRTTPATPHFYVASNLPEGTALLVQIDGVPETLLERFKVSVRAHASVKDGLARTPTFQQENASPFPRGEYRVTVSCSSCEKGKSLLAQKIFFVGKKDSDYERKLSAYHSRLAAQSQDELNEIKQLTQTLSNQFKETASVFAKNRKREWPAFNRRWLELDRQLEVLLARWTQEALESGYYHSALFMKLKAASERIRALHSAHGEGEPDKAHIATETASIQKALDELRANIEKTEALPTTANGMPARLSL